MIKATLAEVRDAHRALQSIGAEKLPAKPAYRVARLIQKLRSEVVAFEEAQLKRFLSSGGVQTPDGVEMRPPRIREEESRQDHEARLAAFRKDVDALNADIKALAESEVEIDYDPIPLSLFENAQLKPADLAAAGPFIKE